MATHIEAYETVLRRAGKPLHVKEIVEIARAVGLLKTKGITPVASARSIIHVEMHKNGSRSTFVKVGPSVFGLRNQTQPAAGSVPDKPAAARRQRRRRRQTQPAAGSVPGRGRITSGRIAVAGRHRVVSELLFHGYEASTESEDGASRIIAHRDGGVFGIRVMTMGRHPAGSYIGTIKENMVGRCNELGTLHAFLLRGSRGGDDDFVTLPPGTIGALIGGGHITKNKAGYQVNLAVANSRATVKGADVSDFLNNWNLGDVARRQSA